MKACNSDLNIPQGLAILWEVVKDSKLGSKEKYSLILEFDKVLGLNLNKIKREYLTPKIYSLIKKREKARKEKNWKLADEIRKELNKRGVIIEDTEKGTKVKL